MRKEHRGRSVAVILDSFISVIFYECSIVAFWHGYKQGTWACIYEHQRRTKRQKQRAKNGGKNLIEDHRN